MEKSYCSHSHCSKSSKCFCSTSHSSKSAKGKAPNSHSSKPSEKKASAFSKSSYSTTGSSNVSYLSVSERRKTAEHAKLAAKQVKERAQRQLKLLELERNLSLKGNKLRKKYLSLTKMQPLLNTETF